MPVRIRLSRRRLNRSRLRRSRLKRRRLQLGPLKLGRLGTPGRSPRLRRWVLAAVLIAVALVPYPVTGTTGAPPAAACRGGCQPGTMPSMVRWTATLPGTWAAAPGLTGTVPSSGLAYAAIGGGVAAVGAGLAVYAGAYQKGGPAQGVSPVAAKTAELLA